MENGKRFTRVNDLVPALTHPREDSEAVITSQYRTLNPSSPIKLRKRDALIPVSVLAVGAAAWAASKLIPTHSASTNNSSPSTTEPTSTPLLDVQKQPAQTPTAVATSTPQLTPFPTPEPFSLDQKNGLKNIMNLMLNAKGPQIEQSLFFNPNLSPQERRAAFSVMQNISVRKQAIQTLWNDRIQKAQNSGLIFNPELEQVCSEFGIGKEVMATAWEARSELAKIGKESDASAYRQIEAKFQVPTLLLAAIVQNETTGAVDFGSKFYKEVFTNDQIAKIAKFFSRVRPFGQAINWNIHGLFASSNGYLGIPQVGPGTLDVLMPSSKQTAHKEDETYLNIYDLFEGMLAINWILTSKGWNNNSRQACFNAWNGYGRLVPFDRLWEASFNINRLPLYIPKGK